MDTIGGSYRLTGDIETDIRPGVGLISANCYKTPLFGNQWRKAPEGSQFPYESVIVSNVAGSMVPKQGDVLPMEY